MHDCVLRLKRRNRTGDSCYQGENFVYRVWLGFYYLAARCRGYFRQLVFKSGPPLFERIFHLRFCQIDFRAAFN